MDKKEKTWKTEENGLEMEEMDKGRNQDKLNDNGKDNITDNGQIN